MIPTSQNQFQLVTLLLASCEVEVVVGGSRVLPFWNGARPDRLLGLMAQKRWAKPGSLEDPCPSDT
jgi:hypothetical protein